MTDDLFAGIPDSPGMPVSPAPEASVPTSYFDDASIFEPLSVADATTTVSAAMVNADLGVAASPATNGSAHNAPTGAPGLAGSPGRVPLVGGPPPGAATVESRDACAWFGDRLVLEGVDLVMPAGEVTALIGPSGCGKSTFLRMLNRMHELVPSASLSGEILLDGDDIYLTGRRAQEVRKRIGMVFQKPNPFPAMTIRENVLSGLKLARIKCHDKDQLVEWALHRAGLWREVRDRLDEPGGGLSGGQQQRLCIARSLAVQPNVLLMDEPCSALDPTSTGRVEETIAELRGEVTVVIVTHNMQQAHRVSDTCAFFLAAENEPGRVVEQGPTEKMFSSPDDPRTLSYVEGRFG
jgi:phosphate transport system ATP-binding protein